MASLISKLCSFFSNFINCNLTISAFDFLSFFIYLLSLFCYLLSLFIYLLFVSAFISFSFFAFYLFFILCIYLFLFLFYLFLFPFCLFFISFLSLFYFFFISFLFLSARRIFVHNYFLFLLYGGAQSPVTQHSPNSSYFFYMGVHNRQWHNIPLIFLISFILSLIFFILYPPPSSMVRSQNVGCSSDTYLLLNKSLLLLGWEIWQHVV